MTGDNIVVHTLTVFFACLSKAAPWARKMLQLAFRRSFRSIPSFRGIAPTKKAESQFANASFGSAVATTSESVVLNTELEYERIKWVEFLTFDQGKSTILNFHDNTFKNSHHGRNIQQKQFDRAIGAKHFSFGYDVDKRIGYLASCSSYAHVQWFRHGLLKLWMDLLATV